jgi:hypothetical protein
MSYRNPQQFVPQQYAQQNQRLQDTIAGTAAKLSASYVQAQKVKKAENKQLEKENKATQGKIDDNVGQIRTNLYLYDKKNPEVNWAETFDPFIDEYKQLAEGVEFGTSKSPAEDRKKMAKILASVGGVGETVSNLGGYATDFDKLLTNMGGKGGYSETNDPSVLKSMSILTGKLPGSKKGVYVDGDIDQFVWEVYDNEKPPKLIQTYSEEQLKRLTQNDSELLVVIPDNTQANNDLTTYPNNTVWEPGKKGDDGKIKPSGKVQKNYLTGYLPDGSFDESQFEEEQLLMNDVKIDYFQAYTKVDKNAIRKDLAFGAEIDGDSASILGEDSDNSGAKAFHNRFNVDIKYKASDFVGNPSVMNPETGKMYEKESELPPEIVSAIKDPDKNGYSFLLKDGTMSDEQKAIFQVGYKNGYIDTEIPNKQAVGKPQYRKPETTPPVGYDFKGRTKAWMDEFNTNPANRINAIPELNKLYPDARMVDNTLVVGDKTVDEDEDGKPDVYQELDMSNPEIRQRVATQIMDNDPTIKDLPVAKRGPLKEAIMSSLKAGFDQPKEENNDSSTGTNTPAPVDVKNFTSDQIGDLDKKLTETLGRKLFTKGNAVNVSDHAVIKEIDSLKGQGIGDTTSEIIDSLLILYKGKEGAPTGALEALEKLKEYYANQNIKNK